MWVPTELQRVRPQKVSKVTQEGPVMARVSAGFLAAKFALTSCLLAVAVAAMPAQAKGSREGTAHGVSSTIPVAELPKQGRETYELIRQGGPFPYGKDGTVFGNRERLLPAHPRGYYREYTVRTRGARDRGARRIVCGGRQPTDPEACYYTADHYSSFRRIVQ